MSHIWILYIVFFFIFFLHFFKTVIFTYFLFLATNTPKFQNLLKTRPKSSNCLNIFHISSNKIIFFTLAFFLGPLAWYPFFTITIFLIMTCYQPHAKFSGSKRCLGGNTQALRKHIQTVHTVHFHEGRTPFCTVCTQWRGNSLAQSGTNCGKAAGVVCKNLP